MTSFKTRKRDGQAFPINRKMPHDSGNPSYVGVDKSQINRKEDVKKLIKDRNLELDAKTGIPVPKKNAEYEIKEIKKISVPHPYGITPKHIAEASDNHSGMLDKHAIRDAEKHGAECFICRGRVKHGVQQAIYSADEHKEQKTLFLQMKTKEKDLNKIKGLHKYLLKIKPIMKEKKIDGVAFLPQK